MELMLELVPDRANREWSQTGNAKKDPPGVPNRFFNAKTQRFLSNTARVTLFGTRINTDFTDDSPERTLKNPIFKNLDTTGRFFACEFHIGSRLHVEKSDFWTFFRRATDKTKKIRVLA